MLGTIGPRTRWSLILGGALVAWTVLALGVDNGIFGVFQDDGLYLSSARSLRAGHGYGLPGRPGEPPPKYPIGLPALLALAFRLDPRPPSLENEIIIARGLVILGGWGFCLGTFAWLRRVGAGAALACLIVLATAFHHVVMIGGAATLFADLPFAAVTYGLLARTAARPRRGGGDVRRSWVDGALAGCGTLLRTNGITLIAAALVGSALGRRRRPDRRGWPVGIRGRAMAACLLGATVVVAPATWYAGRHPRVVASNSYLLELRAGWTSPGAGARIVAGNLASVAFALPTRVIAAPTTYVDPIVRALRDRPALAGLIRGTLTAIVALGLIRLARATRRRDLGAWTHAVGSVAIFAVWPWNGIMDRFLITLFPMVLLAFARGVEGLLGLLPAIRRDRAARGRIAAVALAAVAASNAAVVLRAVQFFHAHGGQWPGAPDRVDLGLALALIRDRTEPDAVIATIWPELVYLQAGRTAVPICEDEAVMTGRYGDVSRLDRWRAATAGRPFYFIRRNVEQDAERADDTQIAALVAARAGRSTRLVAQTPTGRHQILRLVDPEEAKQPTAP